MRLLHNSTWSAWLRKGCGFWCWPPRILPGDVNSITHADVQGLTFLGLQGMIDPPRPEAIAAVRACRSAGIHVKMITGDHALTAQAIARQIGLDGHGRDTSRQPRWC